MAKERFTEIVIPDGREEAIDALLALVHNFGLGMSVLKERETTTPDFESIMKEGSARWEAHVAEVGTAGVAREIQGYIDNAGRNWAGTTESQAT